jgi:ABC-2 type transport system ATP-binding protein
VFGHDVVREALASRRLIGLVPQEINFDPFFSPRELLRFQLGYYGKPVEEARIDEVLQALNLGEKADANTRELSGGMRRRLLIGKALVHRPKIAFLDEPTAGVDVALRRDLWAYVRRLREEGTTIVLTTHYLEEAEELADRVAVIDHGKLIAIDTPTALMAAHGKKRLRITYGVAPAALPDALTALGARLDGNKLECPLSGSDAAPILAAASALGAITDVRVDEPSLEDVFLALTGGRA